MYLFRLRNEIGESRYAQFLGTGIGSTLAFVIDDTGSMSGEILAATKRSKVKRFVKKLTLVARNFHHKTFGKKQFY